MAGVFGWWRKVADSNRLNAIGRWPVAGEGLTELNLYYCPEGSNANESTIPHQKIADLRQKIGDFYFFTITYYSRPFHIRKIFHL